MHDSNESADYKSMPEDDLRSVSGFKADDSDVTQGNDVSHSDHTFLNHNAFAERLSLPDHLDHICEEVSSLHSKLETMESFIIYQVLDGIKSILPALLNKGKDMVVHNSKEKKSEGIISVEDDSDEDDKQPLSKIFKIMTPISDILNLTPLNTFVPEHLLKPKEQQKFIQ
nr:hypothetical protein [Tanacetum cinerariifolium]